MFSRYLIINMVDAAPQVRVLDRCRYSRHRSIASTSDGAEDVARLPHRPLRRRSMLHCHLMSLNGVNILVRLPQLPFTDYPDSQGPCFMWGYVRSLCGRKWVQNSAYVRSLCGRKEPNFAGCLIQTGCGNGWSVAMSDPNFVRLSMIVEFRVRRSCKFHALTFSFRLHLLQQTFQYNP